MVSAGSGLLSDAEMSHSDRGPWSLPNFQAPPLICLQPARLPYLGGKFLLLVFFTEIDIVKRQR